jgi:hypothetical protein
MYMEIYKLYYGNYAFMVELDTGAEVGDNQVTLWYSEKVNIQTIPLDKVDSRLLLKALKEPYKSALVSRLEELKTLHRQRAEMEIAEIQLQSHPDQSQPNKIPKAIKKRIQRAHKQIKKQLHQIEQIFVQQEVMILGHHCFHLDIIDAECHIYGKWNHLRTFYFEEANTDNIQTFCREFATHPGYRQEILTGARHWSKRNALFVRNLFSVLGEKTLFSSDGSYMSKAREFFRWLDMHSEAITAHPDYQRLMQLDSMHPHITNQTPDMHEIDTLIRPAVDIFRQLFGVSYRGSCQGVSGKIHLGEYTLLALTLHDEYGYIAFGTFSYLVHDLVTALLPQFSSITTMRVPCQFGAHFVLRSTGNNIQFCQDIYALAVYIHTVITTPKNQLTTGIRCVIDWEKAIYPTNCPPTAEPGGMLPSRRAWLCQPEHIENTLQLLFHLNHWAKSADTLYYTDRQGLYTTKTALIHETYLQGCMQPIGYIDGIDTFIRELDPETAAEIAAETFMDIDMAEDASKGNECQVETYARVLYQSITGQTYPTKPVSPQPDKQQVKDYILTEIQALIKQARQTRQPLSSSALAALLVTPVEFLNINWTRAQYIHDWEDLDTADLRKLDPESWSLIAFRYESETARYTFHLPYRTAEQILTREQIQKLQKLAGESREYGAVYGRAVTTEESEQYRIEEILRELSVNIQSICPHKLERKHEHYNNPTSTWHDYKNDPAELDADEEDEEGIEQYQC